MKMMVIIAEIPFENFAVKTEKEKEEYLNSLDIFFSFSSMPPKWVGSNNYVKSNIKILCKPTLEWCVLFHETPLYFWVISNNYWYKVVPAKYKNYSKIARWHGVPFNLDDARNYERMRGWEDRIEKLDNIFDRVLVHNFNNEPVFCAEI